MRKVELGKTGEMIPVLGQGTWGIKKGQDKNYYEKWKESLRKGIELGITHIDTAEFYGLGASERLIGEVIKDYNRDDLFITSKIFPGHFGYNSMKKACYKSLERLGISTIDLYLIHFPSFFGSKIKKHMVLLEELLNEGKVRYVGVSNYSVKQFKKGNSILKKAELVCNQLHANIGKQKHIHDSLPYYQKEGVTLTAYSPLGHTGLKRLRGDMKEKMEKLASQHDATVQQIAIAWLINHDNVITIPKAMHIKHIESNAKAAEINLSQAELETLYSNI
ncbi:MAG: aldo/keto reductase [Promethearchaeota archaeon]